MSHCGHNQLSKRGGMKTLVLGARSGGYKNMMDKKITDR